MNITNAILKKSKLEKQRNGEYLFSYAPYGYFAKSEPCRHLEIDESIATMIRMIFNEILAGKTINYISDFLNTINFSTPKEYKDTGLMITTREGKARWTEKMVLAIARNIIYTGVTPLGKRKWVEIEIGKRQIKQGTIEIVEGTHEAIIDRNVYESVQVIIEKGATSKNKNESTTTSLKGWIFCAHCGREMKKRSSGGYIYYRCSDIMVNGEKIKGCKGVAIKESELRERLGEEWYGNKTEIIIKLLSKSNVVLVK